MDSTVEQTIGAAGSYPAVVRGTGASPAGLHGIAVGTARPQRDRLECTGPVSGRAERAAWSARASATAPAAPFFVPAGIDVPVPSSVRASAPAP